jgi:uncharacterized protein (TIGR03435 family)
MNRKRFIIGATVLMLLGCVFAVKAFWFPAIQNVWFQLDERQLRTAPANLMVFRGTLLANRKSGCQAAWMGTRNSGRNQEPIIRYSGRNVPLQEIIPIAYQCRPSDVVMPEIVPTNRYDFLVTAAKQPAGRLRQSLEKKTGFTADWQEHEANVWLLKVQNPNVLRPSTNTVSRIEYKNGYLVFSRMRVNALTGFINRHLQCPLEDKTGLTGVYDFSLSFNWNTPEPMTENTLKHVLGKLGLTAEAGTTTRRMLVVHRK